MLLAQEARTDLNTIDMAIEALFKNKLVTVTNIDGCKICLVPNWDKIYDHSNIERIDELREDAPLTFKIEYQENLKIK